MQVDLYSSTGAKKGSLELPASLFEAPINGGLMHQAVVMQQANRRASTAHTKSRGEVIGSTKKLFQQKGTGRARRGPLRSPLMKGGGKAFGSKKDRNYVQSMPRKMRHAALRSALSAQAKGKAIIGLEGLGNEMKTKAAYALLSKLPVQMGRKILLVTAAKDQKVTLSVRNIPNLKTLTAAYLNPEDVLAARFIIFMADSIAKAEEVFGAKKPRVKVEKETAKTRGDAAPNKKSVKKGAGKKSVKKAAAKKSDEKKSSAKAE
jgi:large subunit ribosomal protein L4